MNGQEMTDAWPQRLNVKPLSILTPPRLLSNINLHFYIKVYTNVSNIIHKAFQAMYTALL